MKKIAIILLFLLLFSVFGCKSDISNDNFPEDTRDETNNVSEPFFGFQLIYTETTSYVKFDEPLTIDIYMSDRYEYNEKRYNGFPSYSHYGIYGHPILMINDMVDFSNNCYVRYDNYGPDVSRDDSQVLINGEKAYYEKIFTLDEMKLLNRENENIVEQSPLDWYKEEVTIQFSKLEKGTIGYISIVFGWLNGNESFYMPANRLMFRDNYLCYYVGENGVAFSFFGNEYAEQNIDRYESIHSGNPLDMIECTAYDAINVTLPLMKSVYCHGEMISNTYKIDIHDNDSNYHVAIDHD